jgi:hypothetical protein
MTGGLYCNFEKAEQGVEETVGRTGDCPKDQDQGHYCHTGEKEQQYES